MSTSDSTTAGSAFEGSTGNVGINVPGEEERINRPLVNPEGVINNQSTVPNTDTMQNLPMNNQGKRVEIANFEFVVFIWSFCNVSEVNAVPVHSGLLKDLFRGIWPCHFLNSP